MVIQHGPFRQQSKNSGFVDEQLVACRFCDMSRRDAKLFLPKQKDLSDQISP